MMFDVNCVMKKLSAWTELMYGTPNEAKQAILLAISLGDFLPVFYQFCVRLMYIFIHFLDDV